MVNRAIVHCHPQATLAKKMPHPYYLKKRWRRPEVVLGPLALEGGAAENTLFTGGAGLAAAGAGHMVPVSGEECPRPGNIR